MVGEMPCQKSEEKRDGFQWFSGCLGGIAAQRNLEIATRCQWYYSAPLCVLFAVVVSCLGVHKEPWVVEFIQLSFPDGCNEESGKQKVQDININASVAKWQKA